MTCCEPKATSDPYKFKPDYNTEALTEKFYARHDRMSDSVTPQVLKYENEIEKIRKFDARCHSRMPRYTNQCCGWLPGYKIRFLQNCDLNIYDSPPLLKVAKDLVTHHLKETKPDNDHCECKNLIKQYGHWKIV